MAVSKKLINYLEKNKARYELVEHKVVYTAWDLSQTLHISPKQVAKSVVVKFKDKVPALAVLPADKNIDMKKIANIAYNNVKQIERRMAKEDGVVPKEWNWPSHFLKGKSYKAFFAKERWIKDKLLGKPGSIPPFGKLLKMPVFMDKVLEKEKHIFLPSGDFKIAIKITPKEYIRLEEPVLGRFSVKK